MRGDERLKILECSGCHHLFKSTEPHITIFGGEWVGGDPLNFCVECSVLLFKAGTIGIKEIMDD